MTGLAIGRWERHTSRVGGTGLPDIGGLRWLDVKSVATTTICLSR
jgi:hypothetical protein